MSNIQNRFRAIIRGSYIGFDRDHLVRIANGLDSQPNQGEHAAIVRDLIAQLDRYNVTNTSDLPAFGA